MGMIRFALVLVVVLVGAQAGTRQRLAIDTVAVCVDRVGGPLCVGLSGVVGDGVGCEA
jgi:hypothetical protein